MALDILIAAVILVGAVIGYHRGIITQAGQLVAVLAAVAGARMAGGTIACWLGGADGPSALDTAASYAIAFALSYLLVWLASRMLRQVADAVNLGVIDRLCGAVFKAAQWCLVLSLALNLFINMNPDSIEVKERPWRQAVLSFGPAVVGYVSNYVQNNNAPKGVKSQTANTHERR